MRLRFTLSQSSVRCYNQIVVNPAAAQEQEASENLHLSEKLETRKIVERAKGILQRELKVTEDEAYLTIQRQSRQRRKSMKEVAEAIVAAARTQFRPILMLILVAMLGMMPAALARGIGSDIQRPLATVVVGGLISTLLLTLVALPAVYRLAAKLRSA